MGYNRVHLRIANFMWAWYTQNDVEGAYILIPDGVVALRAFALYGRRWFGNFFVTAATSGFGILRCGDARWKCVT